MPTKSCIHCGGSGRGGYSCGMCGGKGYTVESNGVSVRCNYCDGTGRQKCSHCNGTGREEDYSSSSSSSSSGGSRSSSPSYRPRPLTKEEIERIEREAKIRAEKEKRAKTVGVIASIVGAIAGGATSLFVLPNGGLLRLIIGAAIGAYAGWAIGNFFSKKKEGILYVSDASYLGGAIGLIVGIVALGILPGFGLVRLIIGAVAGASAGSFAGKIIGEVGFSDVIVSVLSVIGALVLGIGIAAFCRTAASIIKPDYLLSGLLLIGLVIVGGIISYIAIESRKLAFIIPLIAITVIGIGGLIFQAKAGESKAPSVTEAAVPAAKTVTVNNDTLNLRSKPSTEGQILNTLKRGDVLTVTGDAENGWLPVQYGSFNGYVSEQYVK